MLDTVCVSPQKIIPCAHLAIIAARVYTDTFWTPAKLPLSNTELLLKLPSLLWARGSIEAEMSSHVCRITINGNVCDSVIHFVIAYTCIGNTKWVVIVFTHN